MLKSIRRGLFVVAALAIGLLGPLAEARAQERKPNILIIVGDDMGYADVGVQGCKDIPTPHIDSLAKNGIRFTSGYVSGPYCSPTRAGLDDRTLPDPLWPRIQSGPAPRKTPASACRSRKRPLPAACAPLGYATGMVGKWHLGFAPAFHPMERGFQDYFGFLGGAHAYLPAREQPILRGKEDVHGEGVSDRRLRPRSARLHRQAQDGAVLPVPGLQRRASAAAGDRKISQALSEHQGRKAPHLRRHDERHGRRHRRRAGEAARDGHRGGHADLLHQRQRRSAGQRLATTSPCAASRPRPGKAASACRG